jgi:DNA invertase Pin-like site-specific DNA recombinase
MTRGVNTKGSDCVNIDTVTNSEIKRVVAYYRVSTDEQGVSGLGLAAQQAEVESECRRRGWRIVDSYTDVSSGKKMKGRDKLRRALDALADRKADGLVVTKVDRLARSMHDFTNITRQASDQSWALVVLAGGIDMSTPYGRAMAGTMGVFAELESDLIGDRTKTAMAIAKAKGPKPGKQPIGRPRQIDPAVEKRILRSRRAGHSFQVIADQLQRAQTPTPTGRSAWSWRTVERVVRRHVDEPIKRRARSGRKAS